MRFVSLRWVLSSVQCCFDMRSDRNEMLRECEVGLVVVESEEHKGLRIAWFLGKTKSSPCQKFPGKSLDLRCIRIFSSC